MIIRCPKNGCELPAESHDPVVAGRLLAPVYVCEEHGVVRTTDVTYVLEEYELFTTEHGTSWLGADSVDMEERIMLFATFAEAAEMAKFIVEDPTSFPLVGILGQSCEPDGEATGWAAGWAERSPDGGAVTAQEGDYEDAPFWDTWRVCWPTYADQTTTGSD